MFDMLIDQDRLIERLRTILSKGSIPGALLFTGIEGIGKKTAAMAFAMACNCDGCGNAPHLSADTPTQSFDTDRKQPELPCGHCNACRKIRSGSHPDFFHIKPSGNFIKIDQIRTLCRAITRKPNEARIRVVMISDAHTMNTEAANSLLKVLEEPPDRTLFILTALQPADLLPTIVSRCQHIRFNPISRRSIRTVLQEQYAMNPESAEVMAAMADGSLSKASAIAAPADRKSSWMQRRRWLLGELEALFSISDDRHRTPGRLLALSEKLSSDKALLPDAFDVITSYVRDLIVCRFDAEKIMNKDLTESIRYVSKNHSIDSLLSKIKAIRLARRDIQSNTVARLTLEVLIMQLSRV